MELETHEESFSRLIIHNEGRLIFIYDKKQKQLNIIAQEEGSQDECQVALSAAMLDEFMEFYVKATKENKQ